MKIGKPARHDNIEAFPFVYIHKDCGGVAFYGQVDQSVERDVMGARNFIYADDSHPVSHTEMRCGSCGKQIHHPPGKYLTVRKRVFDE